MSRIRIRPSKEITEKVMNEYRHLCAVCGKTQPQLHHIDENPSNNDPMNLLPLCPNCHLQDVHNPTHRPDFLLLRLFRIHKDPLILDPRFQPIFKRMKFLRDAKFRGDQWEGYKYRVTVLLEFISQFEKGTFYKDSVSALVYKPLSMYAGQLNMNGTPCTKAELSKSQETMDAAVEFSYREIESLLVEMIRYQNWTK